MISSVTSFRFAKGKPRFINTRRQIISRHALPWLFTAYVLALIPHYAQIPFWLIIFALGNLVWAVFIYFGKTDHPNIYLKSGYAILLSGLFVFDFYHKYNVDSAIAFLVLTISLKLIEVKYRKDCYLFVFIIIYLLSTNFIFSQSVGITIYTLLVMLIALGAALVLESGELSIPIKEKFRSLTKIAVVTLPLMLILFVFFPRMAPLWSIPLTTGEATTGISNVLSPGDIANLSQSSDIAFRVTFVGAIPPPAKRYWRGLILDKFDGRTWSSSEKNNVVIPPSKIDTGILFSHNKPGTYQILLEPTQHKWGFALAGAVPDSSNIRVNSAGLVRFKTNVIQPTRYQIKQQGSTLTGLAQNMKKYRQLPVNNSNPKTQKYIQKLRSEQLSPIAIIAYLMNNFRTQPFYYTLRPPKTGPNFVDDFLFKTRSGFCSHYAGSLAYMLRLAGIASRIIVGYQGGEVNESDQYLIVHQYDAHAWVEAWLPEKGWFRLDPTAMVAPSRIEKGLESAVAGERSFLSGQLFSAARYNNFPIVYWLRMKVDALNFKWQKWVVGYDGENQSEFLSSWMGEVTPQKMALVMTLFGAFAMIIAAWLFRYFEPKTRLPPEIRYYQRFCRQFEKKGLSRTIGQSENDFLKQIHAKVNLPALILAADSFTQTYLKIRYSGNFSKADKASQEKYLMMLRLLKKQYTITQHKLLTYNIK